MVDGALREYSTGRISASVGVQKKKGAWKYYRSGSICEEGLLEEQIG